MTRKPIWLPKKCGGFLAFTVVFTAVLYLLTSNIGSARADIITGPPGPVISDDPIEFTFDEDRSYGGFWSPDFKTVVPYAFPVVPSPLGNGRLTFQLPETVFLGAVGVSDGLGGPLSDVLNFFFITDGMGGRLNYMEFMSADVGGGHAAATGIAGFEHAPPLIVENLDGTFDWFANNRPFPNGNVFHGLSSEAAVPEPATLTMAALSIGGLLAHALAKRRTKKVSKAGPILFG